MAAAKPAGPAPIIIKSYMKRPTFKILFATLENTCYNIFGYTPMVSIPQKYGSVHMESSSIGTRQKGADILWISLHYPLLCHRRIL